MLVTWKVFIVTVLWTVTISQWLSGKEERNQLWLAWLTVPWRQDTWRSSQRSVSRTRHWQCVCREHPLPASPSKQHMYIHTCSYVTQSQVLSTVLQGESHQCFLCYMMRHLTQNMPKLPHPLAISYLPADYLLVINASNTFTCNFFPHYMLGNRLKPTSQWTILKLVLQIASRSMPPDHRSPVHVYCLHHLFRSPYHLIHHITPGNTALYCLPAQFNLDFSRKHSAMLH